MNGVFTPSSSEKIWGQVKSNKAALNHYNHTINNRIDTGGFLTELLEDGIWYMTQNGKWYLEGIFANERCKRKHKRK